MLSRKFTFILVVATVVTGGLAGIQLVNDDLGMLFGVPPRPVGTTLYENFEREDVHTVVISSGQGNRAEFVKRQGVWHMVHPTADRADYVVLEAILYFSRNLRVEDILKHREITPDDTGTDGERYHITLADSSQKQLADYQLGRHTAWHRPHGKDGGLVETFFVQPREDSARRHVYICSASGKVTTSIRSLLDRGLERLRDHHPLLIDEKAVADITIRSQEREIVLDRVRTDTPVWRMTKPLESRTQPEMVNGLIKVLAGLEAIRIHDRKSIAIPFRPPGEFLLQLELRSVATRRSHPSRITTLTIEPPSPTGADTVLATTDERPELVFELPLKPIPGRLTLAQLPLKVDQLRARTLVDLDIASLKSMTLHQSANPDPVRVFLGRERNNQPRWMLSLGNDTAPANETAMAHILQAISQDDVIGFASNAASNLSSYGLSPPAKRLVLNLQEGQSIDLFFGRAADGRFYAMRQGTATVAEIEAATYTSIATRPYQWRDSLIMPFSIVDLSIMKIERLPLTVPLADPALTLKYKFLSEDWEARQFAEDVSSDLNKHRANQFIKFMETLRVERWLNENSPAAARALRSPTFRFTAIFRQLDKQGDLKGFREVSFDLAPASRSRMNRVFYGKLVGDPNYFVLSMEAYQKLITPLLDTPSL